MSERKLRELAQHHPECRYPYRFDDTPCTCGIEEALADPPDVAAILQEIATLGEIHNESLALALFYRWVEGKFHIHLTDDGWEWTE